MRCFIGLVLLAVAAVAVAHPVQESAAVTAAGQGDLDTAVALWKRYGLPVPPASCVPALIDGDIASYVQHRNGKPDLIFLGTREFELGGAYDPNKKRSERGDAYVIKGASWASPPPERLRPPFWEDGAFDVDTTLTAAIQASAMGHSQVAQALMAARQRRVEVEPGEPRDIDIDSEWIGEPVDRSATAGAVLAIATHFVNQLFEPGSDRRAIREKLAPLEELHLLKTCNVRGELHGLPQIVAELDTTLNAPATKPGSVDAAVVDLVNVTEDPFTEIEDSRCKLVRSFGLAAVPALAKLLESQQITRIFEPRRDNDPPHVQEVRYVAQWLLGKIAGGELGQYGPRTRQEAMAWYRTKAPKKGTIVIESGGHLTISRISVFQANARAVIARLFEATGLSDEFAIAPDVQGTVSLELRDVRFDTALRAICKQVDATYRAMPLYQIFLRDGNFRPSMEPSRDRVAFSAAMSCVKAGMSELEAEGIVGKPDFVRSRTDTDAPASPFIPAEDDQAARTLCYGAASKWSFPLLGHIDIDKSGNVLRVAGAGPSPPAKFLPESLIRKMLPLLATAPPQFDGFDPNPLIRICNALIPLGKAKAIALIREYLRVSADYEAGRSERLDLVLPTLFLPPPGGFLPDCSVNIPEPCAPTDRRLDPQLPILMESDVPLLMMADYDVDVLGDPIDANLTWFEQHGAMRHRLLRPPDDPLSIIRHLPRDHPGLMQIKPLPPPKPDSRGITFLRVDPLDGQAAMLLAQASVAALVDTVWPFRASARQDWDVTKAWLERHRLRWNPRKEDYEEIARPHSAARRPHAKRPGERTDVLMSGDAEKMEYVSELLDAKGIQARAGGVSSGAWRSIRRTESRPSG